VDLTAARISALLSALLSSLNAAACVAWDSFDALTPVRISLLTSLLWISERVAARAPISVFNSATAGVVASVDALSSVKAAVWAVCDSFEARRPARISVLTSLLLISERLALIAPRSVLRSATAGAAASVDVFRSARVAACAECESLDALMPARISALESAALISARVLFCASMQERSVSTLLLTSAIPGPCAVMLPARSVLIDANSEVMVFKASSIPDILPAVVLLFLSTELESSESLVVVCVSISATRCDNFSFEARSLVSTWKDLAVSFAWSKP